jgi:hypothetical protein
MLASTRRPAPRFGAREVSSAAAPAVGVALTAVARGGVVSVGVGLGCVAASVHALRRRNAYAECGASNPAERCGRAEGIASTRVAWIGRAAIRNARSARAPKRHETSETRPTRRRALRVLARSPELSRSGVQARVTTSIHRPAGLRRRALPRVLVAGRRGVWRSPRRAAGARTGGAQGEQRREL